MQMKLSNRICV